MVLIRSLLVAAGLCLCSPVGAIVLNLEDEFWADGPADVGVGGDVASPDVAVNASDERIYVWSSFVNSTDRTDVYMRRFDAAANALENPRRVNTLTAETQSSPRVAVRDDGLFLVAWRSSEPSDWFVRSQLYDASGNTVSTEQLVSELNAQGRGTDISVDVAALRTVAGSTAGFVVTWKSSQTAGDDDSSTSIQGRLIGTNGEPVGSQFQVNTTTGSGQFQPSVTELQDGGFFVVWCTPGIMGRLFDHTGAPVGGDFRIDTSGFDTQREPDVGIGRDGEVLVAWEDSDEPENGDEIRARLFDANLNSLGNDFRVNDHILAEQYVPRVADFGDLGFLVVWVSFSSPGTDADDESVQGRVVIGVDQFADPQGQLNTFEENGQYQVGAHGRNGQIGLTWQSRTYGEISSGDVIVGRHIFGYRKCPIFCDGFEDF